MLPICVFSSKGMCAHDVFVLRILSKSALLAFWARKKYAAKNASKIIAVIYASNPVFCIGITSFACAKRINDRFILLLSRRVLVFHTVLIQLFLFKWQKCFLSVPELVKLGREEEIGSNINV